MLSKALFLIVLLLSVASYDHAVLAELACPSSTQLLNETYCQSLCDVAGDEMTFLDTAEPDSAGGLNRKKTCICGPFDSNSGGCNRCDSCEVTAVAWTKDQFADRCQSLSITAITLCGAYCDSIGTEAHGWSPEDGSSCSCAGVTICGSSDATRASMMRKSSATMLIPIISYAYWAIFL